MTAQKKILDLTGSQYLVQKVKSAISDVDSSLSTHIADTDIHVTTADKATWNTVTSKANDSDVVHKSGDETVAGFKEFANIRVTNSIKAINLENTTTDLNNCYSNFAFSDGSRSGNIQYYYCNTVSGTANISNLPEANAFFLTSITIRLTSKALYVKQILINSKTFVRYCNNSTWSTWVNETDSEYVHKSGSETITGNKTFSSNVNIYNSDSSTDTANIVLKNSKAEVGTEFAEQSINFVDKNNNPLAKISCYGSSGNYTRLNITAFDSNNNSEGIFIRKTTAGISILPTASSTVWMGNFASPFYNVHTKKINALEPSSLSLPSDRSARIDISSYITNLGNGDNNQYIVPANGYIWLHFTSINSALCYSQTSGGLTNYAQTFVRYSGDGQLYAFFPVRKDDYFIVQIYTSSTAVVQSAYFIPCQGNI